jgi:hypothetical protein
VKSKHLTILALLLLISPSFFYAPRAARAYQSGDAIPPSSPVKLIFIHHSTGGNWLADPNGDQPYGGLGQALMENNYFASATNYGWGPDSIGDRTDIINWPEWFTGPQRDTYLDALYNENGQNFGGFGSWTRLANDPGGENTIVMFKSCFPNSDLYGKPGDPALDAPNDQHTVANAKAVYNDILSYFATRQDKLFITITAPPLMESETTPDRAANARAFNNWLVDRENGWLRDYAYANVAVFDYYNVLTAADNHHRWTGTTIEHLQPVDHDFAAYPSGDSHPATAGHQKATTEFVPLLNVYYHRWQNHRPASPAASPTPPADEEPPQRPTEAEPAAPSPESPTTSPPGIVDDFESDVYWEASAEAGSTIMCAPDAGSVHSGGNALHIQYEIGAGGWGDCGHHFDSVQDWSGSTGLALWLRADGGPEWATLMLFSGDPLGPTPFEINLEVTAGDWTQVTLLWDDFGRAAWADDGGLEGIDPGQITGYGISLGPGTGNLWVDDVALATGETRSQPNPKDAEEETVAAEPTQAESKVDDASGGGLCAAAAPALLLLGTAGIVLTRQCSHRG